MYIWYRTQFPEDSKLNILPYTSTLNMNSLWHFKNMALNHPFITIFEWHYLSLQQGVWPNFGVLPHHGKRQQECFLGRQDQTLSNMCWNNPGRVTAAMTARLHLLIPWGMPRLLVCLRTGIDELWIQNCQRECLGTSFVVCINHWKNTYIKRIQWKKSSCCLPMTCLPSFVWAIECQQWDIEGLSFFAPMSQEDVSEQDLCIAGLNQHQP